tara:strand:+ start:262 stop:651 length:390 start_codon:yes stop_codon:yes gene_type:complete
MKIIFSKDGGGVTVSDQNTILISQMQTGGIFRAEDVDREIAKHLAENVDDYAALKLDAQAFHDSVVDRPRYAVVRRFVEACAVGGVSATEARQIIAAMFQKSGTTLVAEIEDADLPADRYFRDAWEWED